MTPSKILFKTVFAALLAMTKGTVMAQSTAELYRITDGVTRTQSASVAVPGGWRSRTRCAGMSPSSRRRSATVRVDTGGGTGLGVTSGGAATLMRELRGK